jgi:hypothetical protein
MPSTDSKLELKAKTSVALTYSQPYVYAKGLITYQLAYCLIYLLLLAYIRTYYILGYFLI